MSWINSDATKKQSSKNDLSFYHGFSKTPVEPNSNGTAATTLANASTKGGHTVIGTEVWAEEIPWFGLVASRAAAVTRLSGLTKLNDLVKVDGEGGKVYKYIGADDAVFTEAEWSSFWQEVTLTNGMVLNNKHNQPVLRYYLNQPMQTLTTTNNASIDSKGYATRLFVDESTHLGQTSGGSVVSQFAAGTDNIKNGIPSVELNPKLYYNTTEKIAGTHYYDYNVSGTVLWSTAVTSSSPKISCFRYIGKTVTQQVGEISSSVKTHTNDISLIKAQLGMGGGGEDGTLSVTDRVDANETALKILLGLTEGDKVAATESIATTAANAVSTSLAGTTDGTIGKAIADAKQEALDAINAIQHFSVVVVPEGQTMENVTPVENTIYLVSDSQAADGSYIEYIAFKQGETVVTEKIGSTKLDLSGYTTDAEHEALQGRVSTTEGQIATITSTDATTEGSIAKALADAKTYAEEQASAAKSGAETTAANALSTARTEITAEIAQAKSEAIASAEVTITAGTGIVVTGEGKGTTFQIAVSDDVATAAALSALSQTVASNKTELEGKITAAEAAASTALETAKTEIKGTTDALDSRLTDAEASIEALTSGDNSVAKQIETAANAIKGQSLAQTGTLSGMFSVATDGTVGTGITGITITDTGLADAIADAKQAGTDAASALNTAKSQTLAQTGTLSGMFSVATDGTVGTGITGITITDTGLSAAITKAKTDAETTAATNLATARDEITTEIGTAVSDLKTELTTGEGSLGTRVTTLESDVKTINETTIPNAITTAKTDTLGTTITTATGKDDETAPKVTVQLSGTVQTPELTVTTDDIASAAALQALSDRVTGLHQTPQFSVVVVAGVTDLANWKDAVDGGVKKNTIYLVENTEAADGSYIEFIAYESGETVVTERIGTTKTDLADYAKTSEVEAAVKAVQDEVDALEKTHADDKAALEASIATKVGDVQWFGENDLLSTKAEVVEGKLVVSEQEINWDRGNEVGWNPWNSSVTKVINNEAFNASEKIATVETSKIKDCGGMFYATNISEFTSDLSALDDGGYMFCCCKNLKTFVGDLSSLTNGEYMFQECNNLETFVGDLSSLTNGNQMFLRTNLSLESVEYIADTISNESGTIGISWNTLPVEDKRQALVDELSLIVDKRWTLYTNQELLPLFDSEKYQTGTETVQPLDLDSEPQTVYYVVKK